MPTWQKYLSYPSFFVCMSSGLLYLIIQDWASEIHFLVNRWILMVHGVSAMLITIIFGAALPIHIRIGLHLNKNILSGLSLTAVLIVLIVSGQLLYYGSGDSRDWMITAHWVIGILSMVVAYCHMVLRSARKMSLFKRADDPLD